MTAENRPATGAEALEMLKQGNARYVDSLTSTDEYMQRRPTGQGSKSIGDYFGLLGCTSTC